MVEYSGEGVQALVNAFEDLHNSNILYADRKITRILKCLAYYEELSGVIAYCNRGLDYQAEKAKALTAINGNPVFKLPKSQKSLIALVSGLLFEFDQKTEDLVSFVGKYFPSVSRNESFEIFYEKVLTAFKMAVADFVVHGAEDTPKIIERDIEFASEGLHGQIENLLIAIDDRIREVNIEEDLRDKLIIQLEGFAAAIDARDTLLIRAVWFGLNPALESARLCARECEKINEILTMYLIS